MILKQRLFTNMFLRNMLADFGKRSANSTNGKPTPYFQYRIGNYQPDYYLYFPKEPSRIQYKNEIFNKLQEYNGYDLINYLDFHFMLFGDKSDFLRFLQYEISDRLKRKSRETFRQKLQCALEWVAEKQQELLSSQATKPKGEMDQGV